MSAPEVLTRNIDAFNRHDSEKFVGQYASDAIVYDPQYPEPLTGHNAIAKDMTDFFVAFPDVSISVHEILEVENAIAAQMEFQGTHTGPIQLPIGSVPPTGREIKQRAGVFVRLNSEGLIVEEHRYYDLASQLQQLGLLGS